MIRFIDGPAAGVQLRLSRVPVLLRVAHNTRAGAENAWDALDQRADEAKPHETLHVYRRCTNVGWVHLSCRPRSASGTYYSAEFKLYGQQPPQDVLHDNVRWGEWCESVRADALAELEADLANLKGGTDGR